MSNKILSIGVVVAIVLAIIGINLPQGGTSVIREISTAVGGTTNYDTLDVSDGYKVDGVTIFDGTGSVLTTQVKTFTEGGGVTSTTTSGATTLVYANIDTENILVITPNVSSMTATLPALSSMTRLAAAGDSFTIKLVNGSSTAGVNLTLASGSGLNLKFASSSAAVTQVATGILGPGDMGTLEFFLATSTATGWALYTPFK